MNLDLIYGFNYNFFEGTREPFRRIEKLLNGDEIKGLIDHEELAYLKRKVENSCSKLVMSMRAAGKAIDKERDFILTQNRECPALYGEEEIEIVFYAESLILFSRASLDILSTFLGKVLLNPIMSVRIDSFNKLIKKIYSIEDESLNGFKSLFDVEDEETFNWMKVLCGSSRGRAVRDQIVHQKNLSVYYDEYMEGSEKEKCFVECLGYGLSFDYFVSYMTLSILEIMYQMEDFIMDEHDFLNRLKTS